MSRPQRKKDPITEKDISECLQDRDDFRLEIEVFRECLSAGFKASHGGLYSDPVTGLSRQYDIRAAFVEGYNILQMAIECKNLGSNSPLIVSRVPRRSPESLHYSIITSNSTIFRLKSVREGFFSTDEMVGKSTTQIARKQSDGTFVTGDSESHEKWSQAIASSYDLLQQAMNTSHVISSEKWACTVIQPVLVVSNDSLWVVDYNELGHTMGAPRKVDECSLYLNKEISVEYGTRKVDYVITHLMIFTRDGFFNFLHRLTKGLLIRDVIFPPEAELKEIVKRSFPQAL